MNFVHFEVSKAVQVPVSGLPSPGTETRPGGCETPI